VFSSWWFLISFNFNPLFLCSQSLKNPNLRKILCSWLLDSRYILIDFYVLTGYSTFMLQFTRRKFATYRNKSPSSIPSWQALRCQWEPTRKSKAPIPLTCWPPAPPSTAKPTGLAGFSMCFLLDGCWFLLTLILCSCVPNL
jgi:hypothetical protein